MKPDTQKHLAAVSPTQRDLWDQFRHDHELIQRLRITPNEINSLQHCALLGTLTCKQDFLFILRQIREATGPVTADDITDLRPVAAYEDSFEEPAPRVVRTQSYLVPSAAKAEPGSLDALQIFRRNDLIGVDVAAIDR